ncbi:hypothetical protein [Laribacter hongkongensis]|uniref:hypothetical protein n=1 Tax=Laribacter hongkongensis TaxID=168471 RepID=UPI001EFCBB0A|nr:hypothetical protein [Laribacter hongkongensis]MCG9079451.1 hypothetical protein [Laribacter hongkongensis]
MPFFSGLLDVLGLLFLLMALVGVVAPTVFKDRKTGEIPKRSQLLAGGLVIAAVAFIAAEWVAPDETPTDTVSNNKLATANPDVSPAEKGASVIETAPHEVSNPAKPLELTAARDFAQNTLRVVNEAEQTLNDAIRLGDSLGITSHVWKPLQSELDRWPSMLEQQDDDQRKHFAYCRDTALKLQLLSNAANRERTAENMKYLRQDEAEYRKSKQQCEQQLKMTDGQIKAAMAAEDAELTEKFGGRDCLTVYGVDKQTGKLIEQPKPAHCKKQPAL